MVPSDRPGKFQQIRRFRRKREGYKELAKRTGITIKFVSPVFGADIEPFNMMINSGDYTDLIAPILAAHIPAVSTKAIEDQVFLRINELVDKFAPNYNNCAKAVRVTERDP